MIQLPGVEWGSSRRHRIVAKENGASVDWIMVVVSHTGHREAMSVSTQPHERAAVTETNSHVASHLGVTETPSDCATPSPRRHTLKTVSLRA